MKHLLIYLAMGLSIITNVGAFAQEAEAEAKQASGVTVSINGDTEEELTDQQKIDRALEKIRKVAGQDLGDKLAVELDGLNEDEKRALIEELKDGVKIGIGGGEVAVAVTAIVFTFGMPIIIVIIVLFFANRKRKQKMDVMKAFLDSGQPVPENVFAEFNSDEGNDFKSGVKLVAIGLGVILALMFTGNSGAAAFGLIPLFIGGARLLFWKYDNKPQA